MAEQRDFIMARLAAARTYTQATLDGIDSCIEVFMSPEEDEEGDERREALDVVSETSGEASRSIEMAQAALDNLSAKELREGEPEIDEE